MHYMSNALHVNFIYLPQENCQTILALLALISLIHVLDTFVIRDECSVTNFNHIAMNSVFRACMNDENIFKFLHSLLTFSINIANVIFLIDRAI